MHTIIEPFRIKSVEPIYFNTKEERKRTSDMIKKFMEETFESRKKSFYLRREKILKQLEIDEKRF